jgi:hypothetical protein
VAQVVQRDPLDPPARHPLRQRCPTVSWCGRSSPCPRSARCRTSVAVLRAHLPRLAARVV